MNYFVLSNVNYSNGHLNLDFGVNTKSEIKKKYMKLLENKLNALNDLDLQ